MDGFRKFWLINSLGNKYELSDKSNAVFFYEPKGLGFSRDYEVKQIGNSEIIISQQFKLLDINGDLVFYSGSNGDIYQKYQDFIQFIKFKPLELHYQTPNEQSDYYSEVLLVELDKSEIKEDSTMRVPATFHRLTEWLTSEDYTVRLTNEMSEEGKYYPLVRPYYYAGTNLSNTPITNNGTDDVGFILTVEGGANGIQNPTFTLSQGNDIYGVCKINGAYTFMQINSVDNNETLYLENNGSVITNPEIYQDFSIANGIADITWCKFRVGQSIFNFTCGNIDVFDGSVTISFKNSYVSV